MPRRRERRRGALLLVVLSILVLFLLIAVTYVVLAGNYRRATDAGKRYEVTGTDPEKTCDDTLVWLLVGPKLDVVENATLQVRKQAVGRRDPEVLEPILEDLYGLDSVRGRIAEAGASGSLPASPSTAMGGQFVILQVYPENSDSFQDIPEYYNGQVLTVLDGTAAGISSRIVRYINPTTTGGYAIFIVEALKNRRSEYLLPGKSVAQTTDVRILVNGRAFNSSTKPGRSGGNAITVNEDYDAVNPQNPYLAAIIQPDASSGRIIVRPSFRYAFPGDPEVDNDGDNIPDSHWIDPHFGVKAVQGPLTNMTRNQKTYYKEQVAVLCLDLDGRLNLNAVASLWNVEDDASRSVRPGMGYGPADVRLNHLFRRGELVRFLTMRYGRDGRPGLESADDVLSAVRNPDLPNIFANQSPRRGYGTPSDFVGGGAVVADPYGQPLWRTGMLANDRVEAVDDPYELDLSGVGRSGDDEPFTVAELEALLRYWDADRPVLPQRFYFGVFNVLGGGSLGLGGPNNRLRFTTLSSHIPGITVPWSEWPGRLRGVYENPTQYDAAQRELILPYELLRGLKMDLNRWFSNGRDDNGNNVVDEPAEEQGVAVWSGTTASGQSLPAGFGSAAFNYTNSTPAAATNNGTVARQIYARHLYCLMLATMDSGWNEPPTVDGENSSNTELERRRIAQWAINVVDFRDPDAIMTPFEYDVDPFGTGNGQVGWQVDIDGNPLTDEGGDRRIVWGCEYPDLLLTETLAFHDRRVKDEETDSSGEENHGRLKPYEEPGANPDDYVESDSTLDQYRVPQGSLFVELYCTGPRLLANDPMPHAELYTVNGNAVYLDLGRLAPASADSLQYPVWRIAITEVPPEGADDDDPQSVKQRFDPTGKPDTTDLLPISDPATHNRVRLSATSTDTAQIDRIVWFAPLQPTSHHADSGDSVAVADRIYYNRTQGAGNVLLRAGSYATVGPRQATHLGVTRIEPTVASSQVIRIEPDGVSFTNASGSTGGSLNNNLPSLGIVAAARQPDAWTGTSNADVVYGSTRGVGISVSEPYTTNYYPEPMARVPDLTAANGGELIDGYGTEGTDTPIPLDDPLEREDGGSANYPLNEDPTLIRSGTHRDYKTTLLQRLADPTQPWHPASNPYITVDWMPVDLTVFNGQENSDDYDGKTIIDTSATPPAAYGDDDRPPFDVDDPTPFEYGDAEPAGARERGDIEGSATNIWTARPNPDSPDDLTATAGGAEGPYFTYDMKNTLGYLNTTLGGAEFGGGEPTAPIPWLTWNNRPFISPMELMLVPWSSPGRLLFEYSIGNSGSNPYAARGSGLSTAQPPPFAHLMDFYAADGGEAPHYYRIFDFVDVPSRFAGTETWYNPAVFGNASVPHAVAMWPPYNKLSRFREPGRVNINTIHDRAVWQGITRFAPELSNVPPDVFNRSWDALWGNRDTGPPEVSDAETDRPFRSAYHGIGKTLLRPDGTEKLIRSEGLLTGVGNNQNARISPYFEFDGIQRLYNLLTTQSNVYAIWVTVGKFECDESGATIIQELGADTGEIKRHRAFYVIDRSIPVAFEPGERHNVDQCVILRRFIE